jgi:hypothetical protein
VKTGIQLKGEVLQRYVSHGKKDSSVSIVCNYLSMFLKGAISQTTIFTTAQFVKAVCEHNPTAEMPQIEVADLPPYKFKQMQHCEHFAQCGNSGDFGTLLNFSVWMLYFVDYENDGFAIRSVAENAICEPIEFDDFSRTLNGLIGAMKSQPPSFLVDVSYTQAIRIYSGWIVSPSTRYNLRCTTVWQTGDRMAALHSRQSV